MWPARPMVSSQAHLPRLQAGAVVPLVESRLRHPRHQLRAVSGADGQLQAWWRQSFLQGRRGQQDHPFGGVPIAAIQKPSEKLEA